MLRASLLRPFADRLASRGGDPRALMRTLAIEDGTGPEVSYITPEQVRRFCDEAARLTGDPWFGLNAALELPPGWFGMMEVATSSAPDLQAAVQFRVDFAALLNEGVEVYLDIDAHEGRFGFHLPGDREGLGRHVNEFRCASAVQQFRRLIGPRFAPSRVWFSHPAPPDLEVLSALFQTEALLFDQPDTGLSLRPDDLGHRTLRADPVAFAYWRKQAQRRLPRQRETPFATQLRRKLVEQLERGGPDMEKLAAQLHMSRRTLHRRLADEQLNFQTVLDELRRDLAERAVLHGERKTDELAASLGYSDISSFLRAFKRWTGMSPTELRRQRRTHPA